MNSFGRCLVAAILVGITFGGCSSAKPQQAPTEVSLQTFSVLYGQYLGAHRGQTPGSEAELRKYVEGLSEADRKSRGISDVSQIFLSPRDGQAYVVRYGVKVGVPGPDGAPWVAHEKDGKDGKRFVAFVTGQIEEVDEARFAKIIDQSK